MASTIFADVPEWPTAKGDTATRDQRLDNQPPLEDRLMLEFEEELVSQGITARIAELLASAERCPPTIEDETTAGKVGDLCRLARDVEKRINDAREKHNRPLLNAQRSLKSKADGVIAPLTRAVSDIRMRLNAFVQKKEAEAAAERRRQEEEARKAREAMEQAGGDEKLIETVTAPPPVQQRGPIARGDLGGSVGTVTRWKFEREVPIAKLPKAILENEKVIAAVDQVIGSMVRTGTRAPKVECKPIIGKHVECDSQENENAR
jgi:hypothetical protein